MLLNAAGLVEPPAGIVDRLHEIDPKLGVLFGTQSQRWHLTYDWPDTDPRWQFVQNGSVPRAKAFDILCQLPEDCSADEAYGYLVATFKRLGDKDDIKRMLDRVHMYNKQREDELLRPHRELANELIETNARTLFREEGKHIPRTKPPRGNKNLDQKKLRDYLHDTAGTHDVES